MNICPRLRTSEGKFKQRKRILSANECFIYQLIESCLKYDLDRTTALSVINLILKYYSYLFDTDNSINIEKMDYRNYRRYVNELMAMNPLHREYFKQYDQSNSNGTDHIIARKKSKDSRQVENLLFLLTENKEDNKSLPYKKIILKDTDDLVFRALIQLDKSYSF